MDEGKQLSKVRPYQPSNGTEGDWFISTFCHNCIHGKYEHNPEGKDKPCDILTRSFFLDIKDEDYPKEWQYNEVGNPCCTAFRFWDWQQDEEGNWNDPPQDINNPNQLKLF